MCCYAIAEGATFDTIEAISDQLCPDEGRSRARSEVSMLAAAARQLALNNVDLEDAFRFFVAINAVLAGIAFLSRLLPAARPLSLVAIPLRANVATLIQRNIITRAANDDRIRQINQFIQELQRAA